MSIENRIWKCIMCKYETGKYTEYCIHLKSEDHKAGTAELLKRGRRA